MLKNKYAVCLLMVCVLALSLLTPAFAVPPVSADTKDPIYAPNGITLTFGIAKLDSASIWKAESLPKSVSFAPTTKATYDVTYTITIDGADLEPDAKLKSFKITNSKEVGSTGKEWIAEYKFKPLKPGEPIYRLLIQYKNDIDHYTCTPTKSNNSIMCEVTITGVTLRYEIEDKFNNWKLVDKGEKTDTTLKFTNKITTKQEEKPK
jgi:hypothetical protein